MWISFLKIYWNCELIEQWCFFGGTYKTKEKDENASVHSRKHLLLLVDLWVLCLPQSRRQRKEEHVLHAHPNEGLGGWIYQRPSKIQ